MKLAYRIPAGNSVQLRHAARMEEPMCRACIESEGGTGGLNEELAEERVEKARERRPEGRENDRLTGSF